MLCRATLVFFLVIVQQASYSLGKIEQCSDKVSPNDNVNGKLTFLPGPTVLPGTNVTIICRGTDAIPLPRERSIRPEDHVINRIGIFGPDMNIVGSRCPIAKDGARECKRTVSAPKDLRTFTYLCLVSSQNDAFRCHALKNLTVTDNECLVYPRPCHANATCLKNQTSIKCSCNEGFSGNGVNCEDVKECSSSPCHKYADCIELEGSFKCTCKKGFKGDGKLCKNDCSVFPSICHSNASCLENGGSSRCKCKEGFSGNGTHCSDDCSVFPSICHSNASCLENGGSSRCKCKEGFSGNGTHCSETIKQTDGRDGEDGKDGTAGESSTKWIITGVICGFVLLSVCILAFQCYKHRKHSRKDVSSHDLQDRTKVAHVNENLEMIFPGGEKNVGSQSPRGKLPSIKDHNKMEEHSNEEMDDILSYICVLDDWEIDRDNLTVLHQRLGGGQFGIVTKGIYIDKENGEVTVAVKMLKDAASGADRSDLLMELYILKEVNRDPHPNVIKLIGAFTSEEPILVITEYCGRGNLRKLLRKSRVGDNERLNSDEQYINITSTLSERILLSMAVDIANGMQHLADHQFVHRDLSARNILITDSYQAKVSDFGLARPITGVEQMYVKSNRNLLPVKWMALESLTHGVFRTSSDVWAFGIVLWEIATLGEEPYPGISPYDTFSFVASGNRLERPPQCSQDLYDLMMTCWDADQENRPGFTDIHQQLTDMFGNDQHQYINVVEYCDEAGRRNDQRRESVESVIDVPERYTKG